jgi:tRNA(Ile)-lysidine synthase
MNDELLIYREFGKNTPVSVPISNDSVIWDNRFRFRGEISINGTYIAHLTMNDYTQIKDQLDLTYLSNVTINNALAILFTLPVIKKLEKVIAVPHISYYNGLVERPSFSFYPRFISRFTHFF